MELKRDEVGEVVSSIGPASVGEGNKLSSYADLKKRSV